ncbi:SAM-dependent methyltransferase [candidate division KSB1 bacterium]|nr:SAM-dependent methyltransferase [candidate division KSB1 bacterium]
MIKSFKRVVYQVNDLEKAKQWYSGILKTQPVFDSPVAVIFGINDISLSLIPETHTLNRDNESIAVFWEVDDIEESYQKLIAAGAAPHTEVKTVLNIRTAKVIDPFGNVIGLSSKAPATESVSVEIKPSETALNVAFCRALAAHEESEEKKGPDYLAEIFLTDEQKKPLNNRAAREKIITQAVSPRLYGYFIARTAYMDQIFRESLEENIPQIVLLGAGYDTRSFRFANNIRDTKIFELDIQTTQNHKKQLLQAVDIKTPGQLSFVSMNFKKDSLDRVLVNAGFDIAGKTLFIWEGVSYYLTAGAVDDILYFVRKNSPAGSIIVFDYMTTKIESIKQGEPFLFWIDPTQIAGFLSEREFTILEHLDVNDIENRFLSAADGTVFHHSLPFFRFVRAAVNG